MFKQFLHTLYDWLATEQSANLAQWAGGIGTVGALFFGFMLFRRDRADAKRNQADRVIVTHLVGVETPEKNERTWIISVRNGSDQPIYHVQLHVKPRFNRDALVKRSDDGRDLPPTFIAPDFYSSSYMRNFRPGTSSLEPSTETSVELSLFSVPEYYYAILIFTDAFSRQWFRDVSQGSRRRYLTRRAAEKNLRTIREGFARLTAMRQAGGAVTLLKEGPTRSIRDNTAIVNEMAKHGFVDLRLVGQKRRLEQVHRGTKSETGADVESQQSGPGSSRSERTQGEDRPAASGASEDTDRSPRA